MLTGLRLLGIGRNQYIDIMNQCRSSKVYFHHSVYKVTRSKSASMLSVTNFFIGWTNVGAFKILPDFIGIPGH